MVSFSDRGLGAMTDGSQPLDGPDAPLPPPVLLVTTGRRPRDLDPASPDLADDWMSLDGLSYENLKATLDRPHRLRAERDAGEPRAHRLRADAAGLSGEPVLDSGAPRR